MEVPKARSENRTGSVPFAGKPFQASFLCVALSAALLCGAATHEAKAEATLLIEADTGKILHAENAGQPWYPASVTKLMTTYVTLKAVKERRLGLDTLLTVSPNAVAQQQSKMGFKAGIQVTVDNALKMLMVKSANDIAVVLAEGVSGSIEKFADDMNRAAQRLGMTQTTYVNPNGLPADGQVTSARDLAILARAMIRELPEYDYYWHISAIKFGRRVTRNFNKLIDRYPGADGMKTGFICASGFNLVASATRNNRRLIAVVLGAYSSAQRATKAAMMLERGFNGGSISWLTPSLGNVTDIQPIAAPPPNMRDDICGKKRKRPPSEDEDDDAGEVAGGNVDPGSPQSVMLSSLRGTPIKASDLLQDLPPAMEPVVVFAGAPKVAPNAAQAAAPGKPPKGSKVAAAGANAAIDDAAAATQAPAFAAATPTWPTPNAFKPAAAATNPSRVAVVPLPRPRPKQQPAAKPAAP
jgi:D-alanyl-D-alanine carboxypeptidase